MPKKKAKNVEVFEPEPRLDIVCDCPYCEADLYITAYSEEVNGRREPTCPNCLKVCIVEWTEEDVEQ